MDLSTLKTEPGARKRRKRVGRGPGSGKGKTAGRGHKGQKSRSGYSRRHGFEGGQMPLHRRLPKRGFHQEARFPYAFVNLDQIEKNFDAGADVTPDTLVAAKLVEPAKGGVKILGRGELTKNLAVKVNAVSAGARKKIEDAGGTVELIEIPQRPKHKSPETGTGK